MNLNFYLCKLNFLKFILNIKMEEIFMNEILTNEFRRKLTDKLFSKMIKLYYFLMSLSQ